MEIREEKLTETLAEELIALSADWEAENSCAGYRKNGWDDLKDERFFLAREDGAAVGYLFGHRTRARETSSVMPEGTEYFELEELYVRPERRSQGVGRALFAYAEAALKREAVPMLLLGTATKDWRAILHFYLEELGMEFWSARLFKRL